MQSTLNTISNTKLTLISLQDNVYCSNSFMLLLICICKIIFRHRPSFGQSTTCFIHHFHVYHHVGYSGASQHLLGGAQNCIYPQLAHLTPITWITGIVRGWSKESADEVKDLGILIDSSLKFNSHIDSIIAKAHLRSSLIHINVKNLSV